MKKQVLKSALIAAASVVCLAGNVLAAVVGPPISEVPEPSTIILFGAGVAALAAVGRRKKK